MARYLYSELAGTIQARSNCQESCNVEWLRRHEDYIEYLRRNLLPSGSGIDCGTSIDLDASHGEKLVLDASFHHMNKTGMYNGWTEHTITVTPSFSGGFHLRISGRNRNYIKDYLHDVYSCALAQDVTLKWYQYHFDGVPSWQWHQDKLTGKTSYSVVLPSPYTKSETVVSFVSSDEAKVWIVQWCEANKSRLKVKEQ